MKHGERTWGWMTVLCLGVGLAQAAQVGTLTVETREPGVPINPRMWGVFFEDINFGADGGLYAELVKNRSFEFPMPMMGWHESAAPGGSGTLSIAAEGSFHPANPHYLRIESRNRAGYGVANEGYRGIGIKAGEKYDFTVQARARSGAPVLVVELVDPAGSILASERITKLSAGWSSRKATLRPTSTLAQAQLRVQVENGGGVDLDQVSLFPRATWKNRPGGLRADMVQWLADMKPGFVRFPGGCIVEGDTLTNRYQWKTTIGPVEGRKLIINRWNREFKHRPTPDYFQSFGLGFFEYFQLCEDIGAEPLPILNCGMACQFNSGELCPLDQLEPYIQDALDLIEFANGPVDSVWGAKRAAMGHPRPFGMRMIGVGNEQWGQQYIDRYAQFHAVLKARHPEIRLVSSAGPAPADDRFEFLWPKLRALKADIVDEHCYAKPEWFFANTRRYDTYDRKGPKVFFGEYAAQSDKTVSPENRNNLECALSEAACMTGLERNGDVVHMASYAPLFAHEDAWQWRPDLIWANNLSSYGTPNYYVQKLFANHAGDRTVPLRLDVPATAKLYASATVDTRARETILKIVNGDATPASLRLDFDGAYRVGSQASVFILTSGSPLDENSLADPGKVAPKETRWKVPGPRFNYTFPAHSLTVMRLRL
jgi:alpha-L-arabinofuranosidase